MSVTLAFCNIISWGKRSEWGIFAKEGEQFEKGNVSSFYRARLLTAVLSWAEGSESEWYNEVLSEMMLAESWFPHHSRHHHHVATMISSTTTQSTLCFTFFSIPIKNHHKLFVTTYINYHSTYLSTWFNSSNVGKSFFAMLQICENCNLTENIFWLGAFFDPSYLKKGQKKARTNLFKVFWYLKISIIRPISYAKEFLKYALYFQTFL